MLPCLLKKPKHLNLGLFSLKKAINYKIRGVFILSIPIALVFSKWNEKIASYDTPISFFCCSWLSICLVNSQRSQTGRMGTHQKLFAQCAPMGYSSCTGYVAFKPLHSGHSLENLNGALGFQAQHIQYMG